MQNFSDLLSSRTDKGSRREGPVTGEALTGFNPDKVAKATKLIEKTAKEAVKKDRGHRWAAGKLCKELGLGKGVLGEERVMGLFAYLDVGGFFREFEREFVRPHERGDRAWKPMGQPAFHTVYMLVKQHAADPEFAQQGYAWNGWSVDHHYARLILRMLWSSGSPHVGGAADANNRQSGPSRPNVGRSPSAAVASSSKRHDGMDYPAALGRSTTVTATGRRGVNLCPWIKDNKLDDTIWTVFFTMLFLQLEWDDRRGRVGNNSCIQQ